MSQSDPIIVTALLGDRDFSWLDGLRRQHFPAERNQVPAHLTLFHQLPPMVADEIPSLLKAVVRGRSRPPAQVSAVMNLGGGVAFRVDSDALGAIRTDIAERFHGLLTTQDQQGWRAHVTIQNKVTGTEAKQLFNALSADFVARPLVIAGLAAWWYRGGPWEKLSEARFR